PPGTVIERQDDARAALLCLIDESGDGHRPAGAEAPRLEPRGRAVADQVADSVRDEARQARLETPQRVAGEVEAERFALAGQAHRVAPFRQGRGTLWLRRRLQRAEATEEIILPCGVGARILIPELHRAPQPVEKGGAVGAERVETAR